MGGGILIDSEMFLTDFMNLKIKLTQSFGGAHKGRMCVRVFIIMTAHTCMSICVRTVFLKKSSTCHYWMENEHAPEEK